MADNDRFVSPYLLRPLRTLDRVLGGRGRALEPEPEKVKGRPGQTVKMGSCEMVDREHQPVAFRTTG